MSLADESAPPSVPRSETTYLVCAEAPDVMSSSAPRDAAAENSPPALEEHSFLAKIEVLKQHLRVWSCPFTGFCGIGSRYAAGRVFEATGQARSSRMIGHCPRSRHYQLIGEKKKAT